MVNMFSSHNMVLCKYFTTTGVYLKIETAVNFMYLHKCSCKIFNELRLEMSVMHG